MIVYEEHIEQSHLLTYSLGSLHLWCFILILSSHFYIFWSVSSHGDGDGGDEEVLVVVMVLELTW